MDDRSLRLFPRASRCEARRARLEGWQSAEGEQRSRMRNAGAAASAMRCVHCGTPVAAVYVEYSPGNIRLSDCAQCGYAADSYVECERMIVVIDLILHKPEAYRHVFFNYPLLHKINMLEFVWKTSLLVLLLDSCNVCLRGVGKVDGVLWESFPSFLSTAGKVVSKVGLSNMVFLYSVLALVHVLPNIGPYAKCKWTDLLMAIVLSSYFKMFVFPMMVWEFSPLMALIIDMLVLSSNAVALKVMLNTSTPIAATAIAAGTCPTVLDPQYEEVHQPKPNIGTEMDKFEDSSEPQNMGQSESFPA